jgi:hypothetical protein
MSTEAAPVGHHIDGLEIKATLKDGDLVASAMVLLEVIEADGSSRLVTLYPDGMSFLKRSGMLNVALNMDNNRVGPVRIDDDE